MLRQFKGILLLDLMASMMRFRVKGTWSRSLGFELFRSSNGL